MDLKPCETARPASWIVSADEPWHALAGFGPPGFESYARMRFMPDPDGSDTDDEDEDSGPSADQAKVGRLCELLQPATATPDDCYFAIWDGWPDKSTLMHRAAQMRIPNRTYYLLHGRLADFGQWGVRETGHNLAAFVWPADHAWCIASDVDDYWAIIGASSRTIDQLLTDTELDIVTADHDKGAPTQYAAPTGYARRR